MNEVSIIGVDLAKNVFQLHGSGVDGSVLFRRQVRRAQFLEFFEAHERCIVAMEACASAHHWGRQLQVMGYEVCLIAPAYVKPFVKRQKNDAADAEAIAEAASRPTMRFVAVKRAEKQSEAMILKPAICWFARRRRRSTRCVGILPNTVWLHQKALLILSD